MGTSNTLADGRVLWMREAKFTGLDSMNDNFIEKLVIFGILVLLQRCLGSLGIVVRICCAKHGKPQNYVPQVKI